MPDHGWYVKRKAVKILLHNPGEPPWWYLGARKYRSWERIHSSTEKDKAGFLGAYLTGESVFEYSGLLKTRFE